MKQEKVWLPIVIVLLIAAAAFVVVSHKPHSRVAMFPVKYGLDIRGGIRAVLQADYNALPKDKKADPALVQKVLEDRINSAGVGEATVQPKGKDQFVVELPDVKDKNAILDRLGTTAQMEFYYFKQVVNEKNPNNRIQMNMLRDKDGREIYSFEDKATKRSFRDGAQIRADFTKLLAEGANVRNGATAFNVVGPLATGVTNPIFLTTDQQKRANDLMQEMTDWKNFLDGCELILKGDDIEPRSTATMSGTIGITPAVTQVFTKQGAQAMGRFTRSHIHEIMGIVLDDRVLSAPRIDGEITDRGEISGGFKDLKEAKALADLLNAGSIPVPLSQVQVQSVEAQLGSGTVHKSIVAGCIGLLLVLVFMLFWYRLPGVVANIALLIYALFTMAIYRGGLSFLGLEAVTLTMAGIAGFILSIGMAVDANILIFERLKEELASGKTLRTAIDAGFRRAFPAIRDSNICTIITCIVLLSMGTASVRGFALTLMLGVFVSLFTAITVTRTLLYLLVDAGIGTDPRWFGYRPEVGGPSLPKFDIIGKRNYFYALSLFIIVPGLVYWLGMNGLRKGIDFAGGTEIAVNFSNGQKFSQERILSALKQNQIKDPLVQLAEGGNEAIVTTSEKSANTKAAENVVHQKLVAALANVDPNFVEKEFDTVLPVVSKELLSRAQQAVALASVLIIFYLASVFAIGGFVAGLRLGTSAVIALIHDVLVLIGLFAIFGYYWNWKIDSMFVTAMLTVIGFSVHDTVVIFDRVRENLRHKIKGETFAQLVNRSILQTYHRSLRTSGTVLLTLGALILFGGQTTLLLNVALFIGIVSGTYSSIFNAASILVDWEQWLAKRRGVQQTSGGTQSLAAAETSPKISAAKQTVSVAASDNANGVDSSSPSISQIKPKKKKPARRF